jgi:hypothetical protein
MLWLLHTWGKRPQCPLIGSWVVPRTNLGTLEIEEDCGIKKVMRSLTGFYYYYYYCYYCYY